MMSPFDDEDEEGPTGALSVARALNGSDEAEAPDQVPGPVAPTQDIQEDNASQSVTDKPDDSARAMADYEEPQPEGIPGGVNKPGVSEPSSSEDGGSKEDQDVAAMSEAPIQAPTPPHFHDYSQAGPEADAQLAQLQSGFANKVAAGAYKPSGWRRALAAVAGAAAGYKNPSVGMQVGEGVLGAPLNRATAAEQARETALRSQGAAGDAANRVTQEENQNEVNRYNLAERDMRNRGYVANQNAQAADRNAQIVSFSPADPNNPYAGGTAKTAGGQVLQNAAPPKEFMQEWVKSPAGQQAAARMTTQTRTQTANDAGLKGEERSQFIATGKIVKATQVHVPSAQQEEYNDWKTSRSKELGHPPDAAEIFSFSHTAKGELTGNERTTIENKKDDAIGKARDRFEDATTPPTAQEIAEGAKPLDPGVVAQEKERYLTRWQEAQDKYEADIRAAVPDSQVPHVVVRDNVDPDTLEWHGKAPASPAGNQPAAAAAPAPPNGNQRPAPPAQAPQPPRTPATGLPDNTAARNPRTGKVEWIVKGGKWTPQP